MKVPLEWLESYVDITVPPEELAEILSMSGTEVERVHYLGRGTGGVVVSRVVDIQPHPASDQLKVALVEDGSIVRKVVCGAPNLQKGMKAALALPGARLPAVSENELRAATIRGVTSEGMLCSGAELGISEESTGILALDQNAPVGLGLHEILPLEDVVLELEITPNRPDCMSIVGMAREVAALTGAAMRLPPVDISRGAAPIEDFIEVKVIDTADCPRYSCLAVMGVEVSASPPWVQRRLLAAGLRPINNVVDVTNYVLLELGQPLHAFDLDLLSGKTIIVRLAHQGEQITTIDEVERQLDHRSLVIADAERSVAIAGVMGGVETEVTRRTVNVLIESAYFNPISILQTSKRLGLRTEASLRFEKGTDPNGTMFAAERAAALMTELAGGAVATGHVDVYPTPVEPISLELRPSRVNRILGTDMSKVEMARILESLEMKTGGTGETMNVAIPSFRRDVEREIDLIEEIARVYGYGRITATLPGGGGMEAGLTQRQRDENTIRETLNAQGLMEVITYSFMRPSDLDLMKVTSDDRMRRTVSLMNPLAETGEVMRTSLLPGLLRVASGNRSRGVKDLSFFEMGRVFFAGSVDELPVEVEEAGILLCGRKVASDWAGGSRDYDFFDLKGVIENLADYLSIAELGVENAEYSHLAGGRSGRVLVDGNEAGYIGQLHPDVAEAFGLDHEVYVAEIATKAFLDAAGSGKAYKPVSRFPNVKVDVAFVMDELMENARVEREIRDCGGAYLRSVELFDVYKGPQIPEGRKSLAYALEFGSDERTLTDEEVNVHLNEMIAALRDRLGVELRGSGPGPGGGN